MLQDEFELRSSNSSGLAHSASVSTLEKSGRKKIPVEITVTHNSSFQYAEVNSSRKRTSFSENILKSLT